MDAATASAKLQGYTCLKQLQIDVIVALILENHKMHLQLGTEKPNGAFQSVMFNILLKPSEK